MIPRPNIENMMERFQTAWRERPQDREVRFLRLAGCIARVRIVGKELATLLRPALQHLEVDEGPVDLRVDVLDEEEFEAPSYRLTEPVSFQLRGDYAIQSLNQTRSILDRKDSLLMVAIKDRKSLSAYEIGRPWHAPLAIWHRDLGLPIIHAGAVAYRDPGLLIGGPSGSGKSHTCLQCAFDGAGFLGDDMVALRAHGGDFTAHSLYGSTFLEPGDLGFFPQLKAEELECEPGPEEKALAFLPVRRVPQCDIKAVILPRIVPGLERARLRVAKPSEVLLELGPSTIQVGRLSPGALAFGMLGELGRAVPSYHLELAHGVRSDPDVPGMLRGLLS